MSGEVTGGLADPVVDCLISDICCVLLQKGVPVCVTVTLMDGLVLARSTFHHSMNYRSCVVLGCAEAVTDPEEKRAALEAIVEHIVPGRGAEASTQALQQPLIEALQRLLGRPQQPLEVVAVHR